VCVWCGVGAFRPAADMEVQGIIADVATFVGGETCFDEEEQEGSNQVEHPSV
jgi:hypothetical protein